MMNRQILLVVAVVASASLVIGADLNCTSTCTSMFYFIFHFETFVITIPSIQKSVYSLFQFCNHDS